VALFPFETLSHRKCSNELLSAAAATWGSDLCTALHWALNQNGSRVSTLVRCAGMTKAAMRDALKGQRELEPGHIAGAR
jgi:hypothetical protein